MLDQKGEPIDDLALSTVTGSTHSPCNVFLSLMPTPAWYVMRELLPCVL
jgi:hypothetical protein